MNLAYVFSHGDAVLITTFLLLIGMSALSWYLIFWKAWVLRQEKSQLALFKQRHMGTANWAAHPIMPPQQGGLSLLFKQCHETQEILPQYEAAKRQEILGMHLSHTLDNLRVWLDRGLTPLASIGSSAPFIGLFGTVWGIYAALTQIATAGNASLDTVAGPMGEALVATALGLFAAIPAVLAYNAYLRHNRLLVQDYRHIAEQLTLYLSDKPLSKADSIKLVSGE